MELTWNDGVYVTGPSCPGAHSCTDLPTNRFCKENMSHQGVTIEHMTMRAFRALERFGFSGLICKGR
jgi:hypothetical protein